MSASEHLQGKVLVGERTGHEWRVVEKLKNTPDLTPGNFSVGYRVKGKDGKDAFCKASDIGMFALGEGSFLDRAQKAINAQSFERRVLDVCHGNNLNRVVTALDYGDLEATYEGARDIVFFLIFEMAEGDLRKHVKKQAAFDLIWCINALHNFAVAVSQLHTSDIYHNDLKPANALIFSDIVQKIADLGRATCPHIPAEHDAWLCAGDRRFAAPEQLYPLDQGELSLSREDRYRAGDVYTLGSLAHFLLSARSMTPEIVQRLRREHRPKNQRGGYSDSFSHALPYWKTAFESVIEDLPDALLHPLDGPLDEAVREITQMIRELCEPDPMYRGHPRNRRPGQDRFGLERYISRLDKIRTQLMVKAKRIV